MAVLLTSSIFGTGLSLTLLGHGNEVQGSVETARQLREINIKAELAADEVEHLVIVCILHKICARPDVCRVLSLLDKFEVELVARSCDTVGARVVRALNSTVRGARIIVRAQGFIPAVSVETVGVAVRSLVMKPRDSQWRSVSWANKGLPAPVGIYHDLAVDVGTAATTLARASLPGELGMSLGLLGTNDPGRGA